MILHRYFARRFLVVFGTIFGVFFLFQALLDLIEQVRRYDEEVTFGQIVELTLLNSPEGMYQILPLIMILSAIALFLGLARTSELVVVRATGRSGLAAIAAPALVAFLIGALAVGMLNPIVAATSKRYVELKESYRSDTGSVLSIGAEGLWLRQGDTRGQTVISATSANPEATVLYDVTFVAYAAGGSPVRRIEAAEAALENGAWVLRNAKAWPLTPGLNPEASSALHDVLRVPSTLTQESIRDRFGKPSAVAIWDLPTFIADLEDAGFSARRHVVWYQMELALPVFLMAMVLLGAGFTMRHSRLGKTGLSVLSAILLGFGLYYIRNFAQILGESGQLGPLIAAWVPPVASVLIALGLILHKEDG